MLTTARSEESSQRVPRSRSSGSPALHWAIAIALCFAVCASCNTITLPATDSTPPTISWEVVNNSDNTTASFDGSGGPVTIKADDGVEVTCIARDTNGGVHKLVVTGKFVGDFQDGLQPGTNQHWGKQNTIESLTPQQQTFNPQNNKVVTKIVILNDATPSHITSGSSPTGGTFYAWLGTLTFTATATNHFNGSTTATMELAVEL